MVERHDKSIAIPKNYILVSLAAITSGDQTCPKGTRGLLVGTAGAQDVTMRNGETADLIPLQQGYNPGEFETLRSDGANTAANIFAIV